MATPTDTLKVAQRLRETGMPDRQAEAVAEVFAEAVTNELVTKRDLELTRKDLEQAILATRKDLEQAILATRKDLEQAILATKRDLEQAILTTRKDLEQAILATRNDFQEALYRLQIRMMTMMGAGFVATIGILATLFQLARR